MYFIFFVYLGDFQKLCKSVWFLYFIFGVKIDEKFFCYFNFFQCELNELKKRIIEINKCYKLWCYYLNEDVCVML